MAHVAYVLILIYLRILTYWRMIQDVVYLQQRLIIAFLKQGSFRGFKGRGRPLSVWQIKCAFFIGKTGCEECHVKN